MAIGRWNGPASERDGSQQRRPRLRLRATLGAFGLVLVAAPIVFAAPPTLSVSAPSVLQIGQAGTFTATVSDPDPDGGIASVGWDFDNNGTFEESGVSIQHSFGTAGQKTVGVRVTDTAAEVTEDTVTVRVNAEPNASFTATPNPAQLGQAVNFNGSASTDPDGSVTTFEWDLDDDGAFDDGTGTTQSATYPAGQHTVRLRVRDNDGATDIAGVIVVVNTAPNAVLTVSPTTAVTGQTINLSGSGSSDADGSIATYAWDKDNDGAFDDGTGVTTTTSFSTPGTKTVRLQVTDDRGGTDVDAKTVAIHRAPTASLTATPSVPDVGETVAFAASAADPDGGPIVRYEWDLDGNGSFETDTATTASTTSSYATRGSKTVTVRVTDNLGATGEGSVTFRVNAVPVAKILFAASNPESGQNTQVPLIGQTVAFASGSTDEESTNAPQNNNTITAYQWIDANVPPEPLGPFGTGIGIVHAAYGTAGDKRVVLRVTDADGATDDEIATVRVNTRPVADFTFSPQTPVTNEPITFNEAAEDPDPDNLANPANGLVTKFEWDLDGDGTFGEAGEVGERVQTSFATAGVRTVKLRVTDGGGARHEIAKQVDVQLTRPNAAFEFSPQDPLRGQPVSFRSTSAPTAGKTIEKVEWDFDNDGRSFTPDAEGVSVAHAFPAHGLMTVAVRVTETGGGFDVAAGTVRVNAPPQASFRAAPANPFVGDAMTFSSTSGDADGPIQQAWDTDNDGEFDDATGAVATRTFSEPGTYTIALLVSDDRGARAVTSGQVRIVARPLGSIRFLDATVTIAGRLNSIGADVNLLRVRAPAGARAVVKCFGKAKGCPGKRVQTRVLKRNQLRFKRFERQLLVGARITVAITMDGFIGRFTRFKIRAGKAPKRTDLCLHPGTKKPSACT